MVEKYCLEFVVYFSLPRSYFIKRLNFFINPGDLCSVCCEFMEGKEGKEEGEGV